MSIEFSFRALSWSDIRRYIELSMESFGTEAEGFALEFDNEARVASLRIWGFWDDRLAAMFGKTVIDSCRGVIGKYSMMVDATELKPQRDAGQEAIGAVLAALPRLGFVRAVVKSGNALTRLQFLRIAKERNLKNLAQFRLEM